MPAKRQLQGAGGDELSLAGDVVFQRLALKIRPYNIVKAIRNAVVQAADDIVGVVEQRADLGFGPERLYDGGGSFAFGRDELHHDRQFFIFLAAEGQVGA